MLKDLPKDLSKDLPKDLPADMSKPSPFACPHCGAKYRLVKIEAPVTAVPDREIACRNCGEPLQGREGEFFLKYFLIERPARGERGGKIAPVFQQPAQL